MPTKLISSDVLQFSKLVVLALLASACSVTPPRTGATFTATPESLTPHVVVQWDARLTKPISFGAAAGEFAAPGHSAGTDELVVGISTGELIKFQASNGQEIWRTRLKSPLSAKPLIANNRVFLGTAEGQVIALDLYLGETVWAKSVGSTVESTPVFSEGRVIVKDASDVVRAFDASTGDELWSYQRASPEYFVMKSTGGVAIHEGEVFAGFSDGHLAALQLETGELLWATDLSGGSQALMDVNQTPIIRGDSIIASSYASGVYSVDRFSGEILWRNPLANVAALTEHQGFLYAALAGGRVVSLDADSGTGIWGFRMNGSKSATGVLAYGPYLLVTTDGPVYILDRGTGYPHQIIQGWSRVSSDLTLGAERIYALTDLGRLTSFRLGW